MSTRKRNRIPLNFVHKKRSKCKVSREVVNIKIQSAPVSADRSDMNDNNDAGCYDMNEFVTVEESESSVSAHSKRLMKIDEKWAEVNAEVFKAMIEGFSFGTFPCIDCGETAQVRCLQCGPLARYCSDCGIKRHSMINFHHFPQFWKV